MAILRAVVLLTLAVAAAWLMFLWGQHAAAKAHCEAIEKSERAYYRWGTTEILDNPKPHIMCYVPPE